MKCLACVLLALVTGHLHAASIEGTWITFDDDTHAARALVQIAPQGSGFTGRIVDLVTTEGEDPNPICTRCVPPNTRIRGMTILRVEPDGSGTLRGTILDPEEGRTYQCVVETTADGAELTIRGYVGIPAFGRTVIWKRQPPRPPPH